MYISPFARELRLAFRPLQFDSLHDLLNALHHAMPDFDESSLVSTPYTPPLVARHHLRRATLRQEADSPDGPLPSMAMIPSAITKLIGTVAQISEALLNAPPVEGFFGHPYRAPGTPPNMFFMLRMTPDH